MVSVSVVIPAYNEQKNVTLLYGKLKDILKGMDYEIIFIDDGSTDLTYKELLDLKKKDKRVKLIKFRNNFGKSAALDAGFRDAKGEYIITMDADLQDDPREIPRFLAKLSKGYDMVSGWKYHRRDPLSKTIPSRFFNWLTSGLTKMPLHDFNCGFKAYRSIVVKNLRLYGDMHRYIPVLAAMKGFRIGEIKVRHHKRRHGTSKYGASRLFKGSLDMLTITFFMKYSKSPLHFFGFFGLLSFFLGVIGSFYLLIIKMGGGALSNRPIVFLVMILLIIGVQFISLGLLAELIIRHQAPNSYIVEEKR